MPENRSTTTESPERAAEERTSDPFDLTTRQLCEAASSALSAAAAELREVVVTGSPDAQAAQKLLAAVDAQAPGALHVWLLSDLQLLTVARWLDHRARLLAVEPDVCGDRLQLHGAVAHQLACELPAGHGGHHQADQGVAGASPCRWVDVGWEATRPAPGVYGPEQGQP